MLREGHGDGQQRSVEVMCEAVYPYDTPDGYEDIFFIYVFDAGAAGLVNGQNYSLLQVLVTEEDFVCRAWNGAYSVLDQTASPGKIQIYEEGLKSWFDQPTSVYTVNAQKQSTSVLPEKRYQVNTAIRFDLVDVAVRLL